MFELGSKRDERVMDFRALGLDTFDPGTSLSSFVYVNKLFDLFGLEFSLLQSGENVTFQQI